MEEKIESKRRFQLWIHPATLDQVDQVYAKNNCDSRSAFIEKAIQFYLGYLAAGKSDGYLPSMFLSTMRSISQESDAKRDRMLFKIAVELAVLENVVAATNEVDPVTLSRLRNSCVQEVKRTHGTFSFEDAVEWQA